MIVRPGRADFAFGCTQQHSAAKPTITGSNADAPPSSSSEAAARKPADASRSRSTSLGLTELKRWNTFRTIPSATAEAR